MDGMDPTQEPTLRRARHCVCGSIDQGIYAYCSMSVQHGGWCKQLGPGTYMAIPEFWVSDFSPAQPRCTFTFEM